MIASLEPFPYLQATALLAAVGIFLSTIETLAIRSEYRPNGLLSWEASVLGCSGIGRSYAHYLLTPLLGYPGIYVLLGVRLIACFGLLSPMLFWPSCVVIAISSLLFAHRTHYGVDGADDMINLVFVTLAITSGGNEFVMKCGLFFIAFQAALAYTTAGMCKIKSPGWRNGRHLIDIMRTRTFGQSKVLSVFEAYPIFATVSARGVVGCECAFLLVFLVPSSFVIPLLCVYAIFHIAVAFTMGLNTFFWAFVATYPAVYFVAIGVNIWAAIGNRIHG